MAEKVRVGEIRMNCTESGQGEVVVFVNGMGADLSIWAMQLADLSKDHRVILFDHRGTGLSDRPIDGYSMEILADDLEKLLQVLDVPSAHLVGHSMGGFVAQLMALRHPLRVKSLVLAATSVRAPRMAHMGLHLWADVLDRKRYPGNAQSIECRGYGVREDTKPYWQAEFDPDPDEIRAQQWTARANGFTEYLLHQGATSSGRSSGQGIESLFETLTFSA